MVTSARAQGQAGDLLGSRSDCQSRLLVVARATEVGAAFALPFLALGRGAALSDPCVGLLRPSSEAATISRRLRRCDACRVPKRVVQHEDQRVLFIVAASRSSVRRRGLVGRPSQTLAALGGVDEGAIPFSTALVLQRALLEASAAEQLWGLAGGALVCHATARAASVVAAAVLLCCSQRGGARILVNTPAFGCPSTRFPRAPGQQPIAAPRSRELAIARPGAVTAVYPGFCTVDGATCIESGVLSASQRSTTLGPATGPFREHALALHPSHRAARLAQGHLLFPWSFLFITHRPSSTLSCAIPLPPVPVPPPRLPSPPILPLLDKIHPRPIGPPETAGLHRVAISIPSALLSCPALKDWVTAPVIGVNTSQQPFNA
ncbi:hypothetical protein SVAN01_01315 [Stagonosporopsis vannaccii]|nr:hypothetical protein SVAN01_01315 [Stagonosporopsis vannaccii]